MVGLAEGGQGGRLRDQRADGPWDCWMEEEARHCRLSRSSRIEREASRTLAIQTRQEGHRKLGRTR